MSNEPIAVRVGSLLPSGFAGTVWSVHESVINIKVPASAGRPTLLFSLVETDLAMTGLSVQLDSIPQGRETGTEVTVRLRAAPADPAVGEDGDATESVLELATAGAQSYSGEISRPAFRWLLDERGPVIDAFKAMLDECGNPDGLMGVVTDLPTGEAAPRQALRTIERLAEWDKSVEALPEILASLVGLGPGMTPAGDDFVCGVLLTAQAVGANLDTTPLAVRHSATTLPGATLLWLALRQSFPAFLVMPLTSVALGHSEPKDAARAIVGHGATSGTDALAGIVWALRMLV